MSLCPFCRSDVGGDESSCRSCGSKYHHDCWAESGGCVIVGCPGNPETTSSDPVETGTLQESMPPVPPDQFVTLPPPPASPPPPALARFCSGCGHAMSADEFFCGNCGTGRNLTAAMPPPPPPPMQWPQTVEQVGQSPRFFPGVGTPATPSSVDLATKSNRSAYLIALGVIAFILAGVGLVALMGASSSSTKKTLTGTVEVAILNSSGYPKSATTGSYCTGQGGYSDQHSGTSVTVSDSTGKTVATSTLGSGKVGYSGYTCDFEFKVSGIPKSSSYGIEVGSRNGPDYTYEELNSRDWDITLTLGS